MQILHIVQGTNDEEALKAVADQAKDHDVSLLLIHDAVATDLSRSQPQLGQAKIYICANDLNSRGLTSEHRIVGDQEIIDLVFGHEKVISW